MDEPASELLELLQNDHQASSSTLPPQWMRAKVAALLDFHYGRALAEGDRLKKGPVEVFGSNGVVGYCANALTEESAIIIGRKGSAGALNLCVGPSWTTDVAYFVTPPAFFNIQFLFISLTTLDLGKLGKGVKPGLSRTDAYDLPILVPPLAEQHRIATKVDELMALCDRLAAAQMERENRRDRLTVASLHRLNQPADKSDRAGLREHARFHISHLSRFTTRPDQVPALRRTILNLAIRGQLVRQEPNGIPVPALRRADTSTGFDVRVFSEAFASFTVPPHWSVEPLSRVAAEIVDCPHSTPKWTASGRICVRTNQFRPGFLDLSEVRFVSEETYSERIQRLRPVENDILYSREGGILGVACRVPANIQLCLGQRMMLIRAGATTDAAFLEMVLNSPFICDIARGNTTGAAAPRVNVATVRAYPIPLPPLAEQHRILAKVEILMSLCDHLEAQLTTAQTVSHGLLEAVLHEALASAA